MPLDDTTPVPPAFTPGEEVLRAHHNRSPGRQSAGAASSFLPDGRTSYEAMADLVAGAHRVLDLGCADGWLLELLAGRGVQELAGIDLSEQELALARRRPALAYAELRHGRAQQLPWPDDSFDAVTAHMSLMLMDEVEQVIAEAARVLADGGRFAVAVGGGLVPGSVVELFFQIVGKYLKAVPRDRRPPRVGDKRTRSRDELSELLSSAGFTLSYWEPSVVAWECASADEFWEQSENSLYGMELLAADQLARLRAEFFESAARLALPDGRLTGSMIVNISVAELAPAPIRTSPRST